MSLMYHCVPVTLSQLVSLTTIAEHSNVTPCSSVMDVPGANIGVGWRWRWRCGTYRAADRHRFEYLQNVKAETPLRPGRTRVRPNVDQLRSRSARSAKFLILAE